MRKSRTPFGVRDFPDYRLKVFLLYAFTFFAILATVLAKVVI